MTRRQSTIEDLKRRLAEEERQLREDQEKIVAASCEKILRIVQTELKAQLEPHLGEIEAIEVNRDTIGDLVKELIGRTVTLGEPMTAEDGAASEEPAQGEGHAVVFDDPASPAGGNESGGEYASAGPVDRFGS